MIYDTALKRYQYEVPGLLDERQVSDLLDRIEQLSDSVIDRTSRFPEISERNWATPLRGFLPGEEVVVVIVESIQGFWVKRDLELLTKGTVRHLIEKLSPWGPIWINLIFQGNEKRQNLRLSFGIEHGTVSVVLDSIDRKPLPPPQLAESLRFFASIGRLPVEVRWTSEGSFILEVSANDSFTGVESTDSILNPHDFVLQMVGRAPANLLQLMRVYLATSELLLKGASWSIVCREHVRQNVPPETVYREFDAAKVPGKNLEIDFFWVLQNYRSFPRMSEMAEEDYGTGNVTQSLLEFCWGKKRKGQMDIGTHKGGGFKVWLSFDQTNDAKDFGRQLKLKLKPMQ